jgi:hypothetical protein
MGVMLQSSLEIAFTLILILSIVQVDYLLASPALVRGQKHKKRLLDVSIACVRFPRGHTHVPNRYILDSQQTNRLREIIAYCTVLYTQSHRLHLDQESPVLKLGICSLGFSTTQQGIRACNVKADVIA